MFIIIPVTRITRQNSRLRITHYLRAFEPLDVTQVLLTNYVRSFKILFKIKEQVMFLDMFPTIFVTTGLYNYLDYVGYP